MSPTHADPEHAGALHHVECCVSEFEDALPFWDWVLCALGYERTNEWDGGRSWTLGPTYVVLKDAETTTPPFDRRSPGLDHLAFHAAARDQVDDLTAGIRERDDASLLYEDQHPYAGGYYALYCEGPDDVVLEVVAPPENAG